MEIETNDLTYLENFILMPERVKRFEEMANFIIQQQYEFAKNLQKHIEVLDKIGKGIDALSEGINKLNSKLEDLKKESDKNDNNNKMWMWILFYNAKMECIWKSEMSKLWGVAWVMSNIIPAIVFSAIILIITTLMSLGLVYSLSRFGIFSNLEIFLISNFILNAISFGFVIGILVDENEKLKEKFGEENDK